MNSRPDPRRILPVLLLLPVAAVALWMLILRPSRSVLDAGAEIRTAARLQREWHDGDSISYELMLQPRRIYAHPAIAENQGRMVLAYGPLLYCLESADNDGALDSRIIQREAWLDPVFQPDLMGGVVTLQGPSLAYQPDHGSLPLYQEHPYPTHGKHFTAVPFAYWDNREEGDMQLWIRDSE